MKKHILCECFFHRVKAVLRLALLTVSVIFLAHSSTKAQGWTRETIDNFSFSGNLDADWRLAGMAFDSNDNPHISYYKREGKRNRIKHAFWNGLEWQKETVEAMWANVGVRGVPNSIAVGGENQIHIAYRNVQGSDRNLKHGFWNGNEWLVDFVDPVSFPRFNGFWNAITIDSQGHPHIAYSDDSNGRLKHAYWDGNNWQIRTIDPITVRDQSVSIVIDKFDNPHVAYHKMTRTLLPHRGVLKYARFDGVLWRNETVDSNDKTGKYAAIKLDKQGLPRIAYYQESPNKLLKYALFDGTNWNIQTVPGTNVGKWCSLDLDRRDRPHIGYYDKGNTSLKYAFFDGSSWQVQTVESAGDVGRHSFIALSSCDDPYIVYIHKDNELVKVARPANYGPNPFSLISPENGTWVDVTPKFDWEPSSFRGLDISHYELWIDGNLHKDNLPAGFCSVSLNAPLPDGLHTWRIRAELTNGGDIWSSETWSFLVDATAPQAFDLLSPGDNAWVAEDLPEFNWQASSDATSGLSHYQLFVDGELITDDIPSTSTSATPPHILTDGDHSWHVVAVDGASNKRISNQTWTVRVDHTAPAPFSLRSPFNRKWTNNATPTFAWDPTTDAGIGLAKYELWIDGEVLVDNIDMADTSLTLTTEQALSHGNHTWQLKALDLLGNLRPSATRSIRVDLNTPANFSLLAPGNNSFVQFPTPEFSWQTAQDLASGLSHYQLWVNVTETAFCRNSEKSLANAILQQLEQS